MGLERRLWASSDIIHDTVQFVDHVIVCGHESSHDWEAFLWAAESLFRLLLPLEYGWRPAVAQDREREEKHLQRAVIGAGSRAEMIEL